MTDVPRAPAIPHVPWNAPAQWQVRVLGFLLLLAAGTAWLTWPLTLLSTWSRALTVSAVLTLVLMVGRPASLVQRVSGRVFAIGSAALVALVRGLWVGIADTVPLSDFDVYHQSAVSIAGGSLELPELHQGGFPILLGVLYSLFGTDLMVAKAFNVALSVAAGLLLYRVGEELVGSTASRVAVLLFALWPAQVMMTSVVATETPTVVLLLAAMSVFLAAVRPPAASMFMFAAAGVIFGVSVLVRSVSVVVAGMAVAWLLFEGRRTVPWRFAAAASLVCGLMATTGLYRAGVGPPSPLAATPLYLASNVLTGTNSESGGTWSAEDEALFRRIASEQGPERAPAIIYGVAWKRIRSDPGEFARLVIKKFRGMWANDLYGAYWATNEMKAGPIATILKTHVTTLYVLSQVFYLSLLVLAVVGCFRMLGGQIPLGMNILVAAVLVCVGLHSLLEAQSRYHHPWALVFLVLAGRGVTEPSRVPAGSTS